MAATVGVPGLGRVFLHQPGNPEIEQLRFAVRNQDVCRFETGE
jgi:hypothetical protein